MLRFQGFRLPFSYFYLALGLLIVSPGSTFADARKKKSCTSVPRLLSEVEKNSAKLEAAKRHIYEFFEPPDPFAEKDFKQENFEDALTDLREAAKKSSTSIEATTILKNIFFELTSRYPDSRPFFSSQMQSLYADLYSRSMKATEDAKIFEASVKILEEEQVLVKVLDYLIEHFKQKMREEPRRNEHDPLYEEYKKIFQLNLDSKLLSTEDAQNLLESLTWLKHGQILDPLDFQGVLFSEGTSSPHAYPVMLLRSINGSSHPASLEIENEMNNRARFYATLLLRREEARAHQEPSSLYAEKSKIFIKSFNFLKSIRARTRKKIPLEKMSVTKNEYEHFIRISARHYIQRGDSENLINQLFGGKIPESFAQELYDYAISIRVFDVADRIKETAPAFIKEKSKSISYTSDEIRDEVSVLLLNATPGSPETTTPVRIRQTALLSLSSLVELPDLPPAQIRKILTELSALRRIESVETRFLIDEILFKIYLRSGLPDGMQEFIVSEFTINDTHSEWTPHLPPMTAQKFSSRRRISIAGLRKNAELTTGFLHLGLDSSETDYLRDIESLKNTIQAAPFYDATVINNVRSSIDRQIQHRGENKKIKLALHELKAAFRQTIFVELQFLREEMKTNSPKEARMDLNELMILSYYPETVLLGVDALEKIAEDVKRKSIKSILVEDLKSFRKSIIFSMDPPRWPNANPSDTKSEVAPSGNERQIYRKALTRIDNLLRNLESH